MSARRSTTTEARAPLSDEQIDAIAEAVLELGETQGGIEPTWYVDGAVILKAGLRAFARAIAARAPAPPSDVRRLTDAEIIERWDYYFASKEWPPFAHLRINFARSILAGPPAPPSVPSVSVDETEAKASAVQRPAGGDRQ